MIVSMSLDRILRLCFKSSTRQFILATFLNHIHAVIVAVGF